MTMDVYGHLIAANPWESATESGAPQGHGTPRCGHNELVGKQKVGRDLRKRWEPPVGIEPTTYALRVRRSGRLS